MFKTKQVIGLSIVIVVFGILLTWLFSRSLPIQEGKSVKVRLTAPMSGAFAYYGTEVQRALSLAFDDNKSLLEKQAITLDFKYEDNTGDKTKVITDFNLFQAEGNVPLVISTNTPLTQPLIPLAESNKVNLLALVTGAKDFAVNQNYVFRDAIMSYDEGVMMAQYFQSQNITKAASLVVNDDYGLSGARGLKDTLEKNNGTVVASLVFENSDKDVRSQITKIKQQNPEAIFLVGREISIIVAVEQMIELGISQDKIYSVDAFESPAILKGLGDMANGIKFTSTYYNLTDPKTKQFFEQYKLKYGTEPGIYAIDAYSAGEYVVQSLVNCGISVEEINNCLKSNTFETIKGSVTFNEKHDMMFKAGLFVIESGRKQLIKGL